MAGYVKYGEPYGDDCKVWEGVKDKEGRGSVTWKGRKWLVPRLAMYFKLHRHIRDDELVLHSCDTPSCYNPNHLSLGTQGQNMLDMYARGRRNTTPLQS